MKLFEAVCALQFDTSKLYIASTAQPKSSHEMKSNVAHSSVDVVVTRQIKRCTSYEPRAWCHCQTPEAILENENVTLGFDATTQEGVYINSVHIKTISRGTSSGGLRSAILKDFLSTTCRIEMQVLGLFGKLLSSPWMHRFYTSSESEISHVDAIGKIRDNLSHSQCEHAIQFVVPVARQKRQKKRKRKLDLQLEMPARQAKKQERCETAKRSKLQKLWELDPGDLNALFPDLDGEKLSILQKVLEGTVVGLPICHV
ncbi:hypothetical protein LSH36_321g01022 [Paralvinella palmiformis]|uniref:Uncharacterized protein n=1 Tax=Paralvinella palmiformis TaxID=53620 RepID=A0AAD9JIB9_9ANNE|nr:hypothetical protein LSH36_321g01022 [Paralvinella palmiformis]